MLGEISYLFPSMNINIIANRAAYAATIQAFFAAEPCAIIGVLSRASDGDVAAEQISAWEKQVEILRGALNPSMEGVLCFEFVIPRIGRRVDNLLLLGQKVLVLEFKVGSKSYDAAAQTQVMDYALDLKNFHAGSHDALIAPILIATAAREVVEQADMQPIAGVFPVMKVNASTLRTVLAQFASSSPEQTLDYQAWLKAGYRPTPTIVEASQALYKGHGVAEITHSEAGAENLGATTEALTVAIDKARSLNRKVICFVSGVPGAGKTLAGLNLVCERRKHDERDQEHAVFLSGNGPLVDVLREALARDEVTQSKKGAQPVKKTDAERKAKAFIQNIHHFRDDNLKTTAAPIERVVVFDEAQRAWSREQASKFMRTKRDQLDFDQSEPEFLIDVMDRHDGWAAIVCLIGGGQEINTGEAGLEEWLRALRDRFAHWDIYLPAQLEEGGYLPSLQLAELKDSQVVRLPALHLGVSLRSFRSERLSQAIAAVMSGELAEARTQLEQVLKNYPIVRTRSLVVAKQWVKAKARGSERYGALASSGAKRLKPLGLNMGVKIDPCAWFLNDASDIRSSYYLEDAGSEFDVQGLELDWTMVVWDGDLIAQLDKALGSWRYRNFSGTKWQEIRQLVDQRYRLNAYRVLLTRARQGMVIVVPEGDTQDPTRSPEFYDPTWKYLAHLGIPEVPVMSPA
ncbi:DUF2075 domain-containing protein [Comamonas resistens]|uniref:DUF2075 domain-containing protein n=1 Tax=Comamonas resistens TaxID=3046670 RepID=A0ABY8SQZ1_9BURK|nr:DUF2075 domain-containing protein [Comamonas resistens]MDL5037342.1 DUF2075 domain-containing protein [Comamonas resistens]WHS65477.1 DUF2075 domain-containing protein [Comamonas resistens]